jgi:hypothetical protein
MPRSFNRNTTPHKSQKKKFEILPRQSHISLPYALTDRSVKNIAQHHTCHAPSTAIKPLANLNITKISLPRCSCCSAVSLPSGSERNLAPSDPKPLSNVRVRNKTQHHDITLPQQQRSSSQISKNQNITIKMQLLQCRQLAERLREEPRPLRPEVNL